LFKKKSFFQHKPASPDCKGAERGACHGDEGRNPEKRVTFEMPAPEKFSDKIYF